jgi:lipid II:glycine glycyltransferase (peptidoglycan interpeptide bridge formation enzyme)
MSRRRQYLPPQPLKWFRGLIEAFGNDLKIRLVSKDDVPIASILTLLHRRSMVYKYGCSDAAFTKYGGTAFLFWKTVQEARECGCEELDMGRSDIDNKGLIAFKERWGAVGSFICYWTYPSHSPVTAEQWKTTLVRRLVSAAPDLALKAIGNALYKHIG